MSYNILEAKVEFKNNKLERITVLVDCTSPRSKPLSDVRAIFALTKAKAGYMNISPSIPLSESLLQDVAAGGMEATDRDEIFPKWKAKYQTTMPGKL